MKCIQINIEKYVEFNSILFMIWKELNVNSLI